MTGTLKLYALLGLVIVLGLMAWGVKSWDSNRLEAQFTAGEQAERAKWVQAQTDATAKAAAEGNADTLTSEGIADQARVDAGATTAASAAANQTTVEKIANAYVTAPPAVCRPAGLPAPLPVGVLEGLSEARAAALGTATSAPGRLQSAER